MEKNNLPVLYKPDLYIINVPQEKREAAIESCNQLLTEKRYRRLGLVSIHDVEEEEIPLLTVADGTDKVNLLTEGSLTIICGPAKTGKSTFEALLIATMLKGKLGCMERQKVCKVGYIDTEQRKASTIKLYHTILDLAGMPEENDYDKLQVYNQRKFLKDEKFDALEEICQNCQDGVLVVDNAVDYVSNFNEPEQSQDFVVKLMAYSAKYNVALVVAIHTNKGNENLRGHLGTILEQKADHILQIEKELNDFKVSTKNARGLAIPEFKFWYDEDDKLYVEENSVEEKTQDVRHPSKAEVAEIRIVDYLMKECEGQKATRKELIGFHVILP